MKLYLTPHACSLAVDIVARELEIPLDLEWVDVRAKRLRDGSDYYKINPKGQVPTLELRDGQRLTEGPVIVQYLADQRPKSSLLAPAGTLERYRTLEWLNFISSELHKGFTPLCRNTGRSRARTCTTVCNGSTSSWPVATSWPGRLSPWPMPTATPS